MPQRRRRFKCKCKLKFRSPRSRNQHINAVLHYYLSDKQSHRSRLYEPEIPACIK